MVAGHTGVASKTTQWWELLKFFLADEMQHSVQNQGLAQPCFFQVVVTEVGVTAFVCVWISGGIYQGSTFKFPAVLVISWLLFPLKEDTIYACDIRINNFM